MQLQGTVVVSRSTSPPIGRLDSFVAIDTTLYETAEMNRIGTLMQNIITRFLMIRVIDIALMFWAIFGSI
jgi:hypothetical protein